MKTEVTNFILYLQKDLWQQHQLALDWGINTH